MDTYRLSHHPMATDYFKLWCFRSWRASEMPFLNASK